MAEPRTKKPSSRLGKLMARFSDSSNNNNNNKRESLTKRASLKRMGSKGADVGWHALSESPRANQGSTPKSTRSSDKEITTPQAVTVTVTSNGRDDSDDEMSMSTVLPRNMKCVRLSHSLVVRGIDAESHKPSSEFPIVKGKGVKSKKREAGKPTPEKSSRKDSVTPEKSTQSEPVVPGKSPAEPVTPEKSEPTNSEKCPSSEKVSHAIMSIKVDSSSGDFENETTFHEESPSNSSTSISTPRSARSVSNPVTPSTPADSDGFATPTMTMRSKPNTPRAKSRVANQAPPSTLQDSLKRSQNMFSSRKSSYESALAMGVKHQEIGRKSKNSDMEELDTLRRGTNMSGLKRSLTETWGKRVAEAEEESKTTSRHGTPKSNTLGAPEVKSRMKRSPSLVLRAMSQRYLETAKSETEFKRRKSEFAVRRKAGIRTLDEEKKKKATEIIEKNMAHKSKVGKEGMLSDYIQACDPAHLQDLIDRGLIEAQATNDNGEIDISKIESNEFNLNNNEFMGRLGREQFEDKVHEIVDFVADNKQIKILSLTNAGVDTYFGIQIARMMMENEHITELNLESNDIYEQGIELLAQVINKNKSLKILKLTNQKRYPSHTAKNALIKALENNHEIIRFSYDFMTIQQNDLKDKYVHRNQKWSRHQNRMAPTRSPTLVSSRRRRTVMERVSTAKQNSLLDIALQRYSQTNASQVKFDLSQMSPSFRRLTDLQMVETISKIESILNGNPFIERVIFKNSSVKDDLARAIAKCLATNAKVRELNLEANDLSSDFQIELIEILKDNTALQVLNVRHQRKQPSRAVATAFVKFLEKNHTILRIGFKFTQTREEHLKERYLKRNANEWRTERATRKAEEAEKQRMLEAQEEEEEENAGQSEEQGQGSEGGGQLQPTLGGLGRHTEIDANLSSSTTPLISPLMSPVTRDRRGRPLSWGGNMELELDMLMPATPKGGAQTPSSTSAASSFSALSSLSVSPAVTPRAKVLAQEKSVESATSSPAGTPRAKVLSEEKYENGESAASSPAATPRAKVLAEDKSENDDTNSVDSSVNPSEVAEAGTSAAELNDDKSNDSNNGQSPKSKPVPLAAQPSFTQFSMNFSALAADEDAEDDIADEDEEAVDVDDNMVASVVTLEEAPVAVDEAPATMDSSDDEDDE